MQGDMWYPFFCGISARTPSVPNHCPHHTECPQRLHFAFTHRVGKATNHIQGEESIPLAVPNIIIGLQSWCICKRPLETLLWNTRSLHPAYPNSWDSNLLRFESFCLVSHTEVSWNGGKWFLFIDLGIWFSNFVSPLPLVLLEWPLLCPLRWLFII